MMEPQLPLKSVFIIVFIFAKRQITRFTVKSRGPYTPIGSGAPKSLRREIERRLQRVGEIKYEPKLLREVSDLDDLSRDAELHAFSPSCIRTPHSNLKLFLLEKRHDGPLKDFPVEDIEVLCQKYDHARHNPEVYTREDYNTLMTVLRRLCDHIREKTRVMKLHASTDTLEIGNSRFYRHSALT